MKSVAITAGVIVAMLIISGLLFFADRGGYQRATLEKMELLRDIDQNWRDEMTKRDTRNNQLQLELFNEKETIKANVKTINAMVKDHVKDNLTCNYNRATVFMLNKAWRNSGNDPLQSPGEFQREASQTSTITQSAAISKQIEYAEWCTSLEVQFDKLATACN